MESFTVQGDSPQSLDVQHLLKAHLEHANTHSEPDDVHALDLAALMAPNISFFSVRNHGMLMGIGALKRLDADHSEIKSMHTAAEARGRGVARAMVLHLLDHAQSLGCSRVSLETGSMEAFQPARSLYESLGFQYCDPFADYPYSPNSVCMTLEL